MSDPSKILNSTELLVEEATRRGISTTSFSDIDPNVHVFELNGHREPIYFTRTDHGGAATHRLTNNKIICTRILRQAGYPVPEDLITNDLAEAEDFLTRHQQVVVKPISNTGGSGITTDVTTPAQLKDSFEEARDLSYIRNVERKAIVQQFVPGDDFRVLVIDMTHIFSIQRIPAHVIGDGKLSVEQLTAKYNKQRIPACHIKLERTAKRLLQQQDLSPTSIPALEQHVRLSGVANFHAGGRLHDATDIIGPTVKQMAIAIAKYFNSPIIGIDFISPDIANQPGYIIELNSTPDLTIHHTPDQGESRDATGAVIDMLFPETA